MGRFRSHHRIIIYLRVKKASALVYACSDENIKYAPANFCHCQEDASQRSVTHIDVPREH